MEKKTCCICGKEIVGWGGNNPYGAIDDHNKVAKWHIDEECCDECNATYVISGRLALMKAREIVDQLNFKTVEEGLAQLRSFHTEGIVSDQLYDFILANWDDLTIERERNA